VDGRAKNPKHGLREDGKGSIGRAGAGEKKKTEEKSTGRKDRDSTVDEYVRGWWVKRPETK